MGSCGWAAIFNVASEEPPEYPQTLCHHWVAGAAQLGTERTAGKEWAPATASSVVAMGMGEAPGWPRPGLKLGAISPVSSLGHCPHCPFCFQEGYHQPLGPSERRWVVTYLEQRRKTGSLS